MKYLILFLLIFSSCTNELYPQPSGDDLIVIQSFTFVPHTIQLAAGSELFFYNKTQIVYRIVSQSAEDAFDDSGEFDSLDILPDNMGVITLPEDAASGDRFYFYDLYLGDALTTPSGIIEIL